MDIHHASPLGVVAISNNINLEFNTHSCNDVLKAEDPGFQRRAICNVGSPLNCDVGIFSSHECNWKQ